jgi:hypothetical protein
MNQYYCKSLSKCRCARKAVDTIIEHPPRVQRMYIGRAQRAPSFDCRRELMAVIRVDWGIGGTGCHGMVN